MGLLFFDVNRFKRINDEFGHDVGDHAIVTVARHLMSAFPQPHVVARIGGEEFAVLLPETDADSGYQIGNEPRQQIEALAIAHPASPVAPVITGKTTTR